MWATDALSMCCGTGYPNGTCVQVSRGSNLAFEVPVGKVINNRTSGSTRQNVTVASASDSVSTSGSTAITTVTVTMTLPNQQAVSTACHAASPSASHSPTSHDAAIGAGIGVPLGVALVGALALWWRQHRQAQRLKKQIEGIQGSSQNGIDMGKSTITQS